LFKKKGLKIPKGLIAVTQRGTDNTMFEDTIGFNSCNSKRNRQYNV
jgi:hypothetical protein